jgi:hypothetical protein
MKNLLIGIAFTVIGSVSVGAQSPSVQTQEVVSQYHYRFQIEGIDTRFVAEDVRTALQDVFKVEPTYDEKLKQFHMISSEPISEIDLKQRLNYQITWFRKEPIL